MSRIDRRTFALGCLVLPLTGCADPNPGPGSVSKRSQLPQPAFLNYGYWTSDPPVFVVTGGIKP